MITHEINDRVNYDGEICVIIPCYNYAHYIKEAIDSLRQSTYKDFCCVIVNDGSTDNSEEVIKECVGDDDRFHYFSIENHGLAYVRNFGIGKTNSKYVLSLDPDDKISPTYIEGGLWFLNENKDFSVYYGRAKMFFDDGKETQWNLPPYAYRNLLLGNMIYSACIIRRSDFDKTDGYDETMKAYEDWEFLIRLLSHGGKVYMSDDLVFFYRRHEGSMDNIAQKHYKDYFQYIYEKNKELYLKNNLGLKF